MLARLNLTSSSGARLCAAVLVMSGVLTGCPQLTGDDFQIDRESAAGPGRGSAGSTNIGDSRPTTDRTTAASGSGNSLGGAGTSGARSASGGSPVNVGAGSSDSAGLGGTLATAVPSDTGGVVNNEIGGQSSIESGGSVSAGGTSSIGGASIGTGGVPSSGGTSGTGTFTSPAAGGAEVTDCSNMVVLTEPLVASFDDWDGSTDLYAWRFTFNGSDSLDPVTAAFDRYNDGSGDYALNLVSGAQNTRFAASATNPAASRWGGGVMLTLHCFDASAYKGLQFWIKGSTPARTAAVALGLEAKDASYQFDIPAQWQQLRVPFSAFSGWGNDRLGQGILFISFSSQLRYVGSTAQEGSFEITVDEVGFY